MVDQKFEETHQFIKDTVSESTESLARIIATTVAEPMERHFEEMKDYIQVRNKVDRHEVDIQRIKNKLKISN